ncbi:MAG: hypothetical protein V4739_03305 [Pseudomonadota bacterium]
MSSPNPALVTDRAAQRMPRWALLLFCAAYVLPGLFGRDPWKSADITAFGYMLEIAAGHTAWLQPELGGLTAEGALLPYWLGALSIKVLGGLIPTALAARLPFAILLGVALALTWYATYHLARTEAAQPLPFAFGGEAQPMDYARAVADGALLAQMATLGLLQLGHETTPEMVQLVGAALYLYALAACPFRPVKACLALLASLTIMAASGAPAMAMGMGVLGTLICWRSHYPEVRRFAAWGLLALALAAAVASGLNAWAWRLQAGEAPQPFAIVRMLAWFTWPAWPLTLWTLWRWRRHGLRRHISLPLSSAAIGLAASVLMGGSDRALMLAVPSLAVLAAFALPTLGRGTSAAIDWFSVCFFSMGALVIWVVYVAMQTGYPTQPAANVARLAPGLNHSFQWVPLVAALLGTVAWGWLVHWRAGRNRHPLWKSLVLPAGGVALCWLLLMSLWLPLLDYARSLRPLVQRVAQHVPLESCVAVPDGSKALVAGLIYFGRYKVEAEADSFDTTCEFLIQSERPGADVSATPVGWMFIATERRPTNRDDNFVIYRREPKDSVPRMRR